MALTSSKSRLFDTLGISRKFPEGVLKSFDVTTNEDTGFDESKSVDQLATGRPGKMMRSANFNAELRYLVEVDEDCACARSSLDGYLTTSLILMSTESLFQVTSQEGAPKRRCPFQ